jgi:glycerate-2-kinase
VNAAPGSPDVRALTAAILADLHPERLLPARVAVGADRIEVGGETVPLQGVAGVTVLGLGKAAAAQVRVLRALLREGLDPGLALPPSFAVTKEGHGASDEDGVVLVGAHPQPDARSRSAASELLWRARSTPVDHLLLICLSGGGSALAVAPRDPFGLREKLQAHAELLLSGASIDETNLIRREMSAFKNGGLLAAAGARRVLTLVTSDVPAEDLAVVASGPTMFRRLDPGRVREVAAARLSKVLARRIEAQLLGRQRRSWNAHLEAAVAEHAAYVGCVGDYATLVGIAERRLRAAGLERIRALDRPCDAPVEDGVALHLSEVARAARGPGGWALVSGGELPVRVRGGGRGGRNTEFVVRMAKALWLDRFGAIPDAVRENLVVVSVGTDGSDGPTGAAGGFMGRADLERALGAGLSVDEAIAGNDTLTFLERIGCALVTGPTQTNLMDLRLIIC